MSTAFVFPGQGSQSIGMLGAFAASSPVVNETFAEASAALGYDLWQLVTDGPAERLNETERTQPAMVAAGVATWRLWLASGGATPDIVCGHSVGEFAALVATGTLSFADAIALVRLRGELMQQAVPVGQGAIAAVLGLDDAVIEEVCLEVAAGEVVDPVNYNSPGQLVIAGHATAVQRALDALKARGAKRAVLLPMSVPAHSALMKPAAARFAAALDKIDFKTPRIGYWSPVDAVAHPDAADIRALLSRQLASPVRWSALVTALAAAGVSRFVECGPGKVLTSLNRRIDKRPEVQCLALQDPDSLAAVLAAGTGAN
jgi:[acyl-carrier-protein] S-malonyltransferase